MQSDRSRPPRFFADGTDRALFWVAVAGVVIVLAIFVLRTVVRIRIGAPAAERIDRLELRVEELEDRVKELEEDAGE